MNAAADIMRQPATRSELLKRRLDAFSRALKAIERDDVRALHRARVASRRLRELLPVLQLEPGAARKLQRRLRKVTSRLGAVRELDVLLMSIDELHHARRARGGALGHVGVAVSKDRDRARKRLAARLPVASMLRLARKLERVVGSLQVEEAGLTRAHDRLWRSVVDARVVKRAARLSGAMDEAGAVYLPDRLHGVRIALKKLRYATELAQETMGERDPARLRLLKRGQDLLGRIHDLHLLMDRVRRVQASLTPTTLMEWRDLDALTVSLEDDCRRLHARYMAVREPLAAIAGSVQTRLRSPAATRRAG
jgi:CHAD domain-containing protein